AGQKPGLHHFVRKAGAYPAYTFDLNPSERMSAVDVPEQWMQGRTLYGGLSAALCLEAALRAFPDAPPLRSAQISFVGPAGGAVSMKATMLRQGRSVTFIGADLFGEKGLATRAVFCFGAARESMFDRDFTEAPDAPGVEESDVFIPEGLGPSFAQFYDNRLAKGGRPISGVAEHDHYIWVRHRDQKADDIVALLALADMPPPAMLPMFPQPAPISSMTWMLNFLTDKPATEDGWWLMQTRAENAGEGYSSQDMMVWNAERKLVIAGRQSVAIFI
ncbi:MAG: thioesterase family protein, partial [Pseudomonadota bacterium]